MVYRPRQRQNILQDFAKKTQKRQNILQEANLLGYNKVRNIAQTPTPTKTDNKHKFLTQPNETPAALHYDHSTSQHQNGDGMGVRGLSATTESQKTW